MTVPTAAAVTRMERRKRGYRVEQVKEVAARILSHRMYVIAGYMYVI